MVKTWPSKAGGEGVIPGQGAEIPDAWDVPGPWVNLEGKSCLAGSSLIP